ncbi:sodium-coupled monocarboxylate transporter 1-like [Dermacentor silvarum]|uniref:sodium-coupled monocarboxylate transporter 1-like n=1 Tax=Dermacentor silvarum TaxID=543639 RepID=UPI0021013AE9|nr:sodium-coupled monocarboxylate transporter 1-like [Dermacentor silvarum]
MAAGMYRSCLDQMVAQRLLASRTLPEARRTAVTSAFLLALTYTMPFIMALALTAWFRGCDPTLLGAIKSMDQILPYYVRTYLVAVPGLSGLFLAGIVSAATSTVSSAINSQAAILYVDVIAPRYKSAEVHVLWITRAIAMTLGAVMTVYSTVCLYMGSITTIFLMVSTGLTAPFVGLCLLGVLFPFVHSKGAGVATLIMVVYQLSHTANMMVRGKRPQRMPVSLDHCPGNLSLRVEGMNITSLQDTASSEETFFFFRLSLLWSSAFAILATIFLGVVLSALTGEIKNKEEQPQLCSDALVRIWRARRAPQVTKRLEMEESRQLKNSKENREAESENLFPQIAETDV